MKSSFGRVNGQPHSGSRKDGAFAFICFYLAGASMTDAGAMKRSTGVKILPQGGIAFLLEALGVKLSDRMFGIQAAGSPSCMELGKPETGRKGANFFGPATTRMNRFFPISPILSTHGRFASGQTAGYGAATMAVCED